MSGSYSEREVANRRIAIEAYETVLAKLDAERVDDYFLPGYIQHSPLAADGAEGLKTFLRWARAASPDCRTVIKRVFADGDYVIFHVHVIIHPGDTGNAVVDIFRMEDGRIAEHWDVNQQVPASMPNRNGMF